jgi:aminoglycoside phosphotransferase (APT) family kinase protein
MDERAALTDVAEFIAALQRIDATGAPPTGSRGGPLAPRDPGVRRAIGALVPELDAEAATAVWEEALAAPVWDGPPRWIHGDLDRRNLLVENGRITAVLDFGSICAGDPACDVMVAWKLFSPRLREDFRTVLDVDDATWARARGWVLSQALAALAYYTPSNNPSLVREAWLWVAAALE